MQDNALIRLFLPILQTQIPLYGYGGVVVQQSNQPTMQGVNTAATVYFYKVSDHRYGWPRKIDFWDVEASTENHVEEQWYETKFQLSALVLQNPKTPNAFTASDLVNTCAAILQSDSTLNTLASSSVGILRIADVTNPYFSDDRDQYEAAPAFEFTLTHRQTRVTTDPVISSSVYNINRV